MGLLNNSKELDEIKAENENLKKRLNISENNAAIVEEKYSVLQRQARQLNKDNDEFKKRQIRLESLEEENKNLIHRCEGLGKAVGKLQSKAKKKTVEPGVVSSERYININNKWIYKEGLCLPVLADPLLAREVWAYAEKQIWFNQLRRISYNDKYGWVAYIDVTW